MLVNLLALTAFALVPSEKPEYAYSADVTVQAQKRDSYIDDADDFFTIDNRYVFYCHLYFNNENDYQFYYSGVQWSANLYDEYSGEYVAFYSESWYLETDIQLFSYSSFEINTSFDAEEYYISTISFDYNTTEEYGLELPYLLQPASPSYNQNIQCIWVPIFDFDLPALIKSNSYQLGYDFGYSEGLNSGDKQGYNLGYQAGYNDAQADGGVPAIIFGGILNVAMIPVNFFLAILNFEVFGINIGGFVTGLMTIAVIIILFGIIFGGRPSPSSKGGGK